MFAAPLPLVITIYLIFSPPAELAGWQIGEVITAINGEPISADYWQGQYRWNQADVGTALTLGTADGRTRTITCEDYY